MTWKINKIVIIYYNPIEDLLNRHLIPELTNIVIDYTNETRDNFNKVVNQIHLMNKQISHEGLMTSMFKCSCVYHIKSMIDMTNKDKRC